ncbi:MULTISPECIES: helix-turn-helix transcriptional regulator [Streptomyces]|uniref:helix-turn-helix transcriptional regulator n=1 Tax=Streptomyces TaxID=1883 RepID=UPI0009967561|nr:MULTISPECIES: WYL domain-containing protein [Streptomyces]
MTITDEDCLPETLAFNEQFERAAASRPARGRALDAATLAFLRRNRLAGDTPPLRLPHGRDRTVEGGVKVRVFVPERVEGVYSAIRTAVERALADGTVLRLSYTDAAGRESDRAVEPAGLLTADGRWYLIAWCRTRRAGRGFRLDRITAAAPTGERAQPHDLTELLLGSAAAGAVPPTALAPLVRSR